MWIFGLIGGALAVLMLPLAFALGTYVPLIVSDLSYNVYTTIGMKNWARELFGSNGSGYIDFKMNMNSPLAWFMMFAIMAGVLCFAIWLITRFVVATWNVGKRHNINFFRLAYGVLAIVLVPVMFFTLIGITSILFQALSPDSANRTLTQGDIDTLTGKIDTARQQIDNILNGNSFDGSTYQDALMTLRNALDQIRDGTTNSDLKTLCDNLQQNIDDCMQYATATQMDTLLQAMRAAVSGLPVGGRATDFGQYQDAYINLLSSSVPFNSLMDNLKNLLHYSHQSTDAGWDVAEKFFANAAPMNPGADGYTHSVGYIFTFDYSFQYGSGDSAKNIEYTGLLGQLFNGGGKIYQSGEEITIDPYVGLSAAFSYANPMLSFQFNQMIYEYLTGTKTSAYSFAALYGLGFINIFGHIDRYIIGVMVASISASTMMMYAWYMVGRVLELIVFWAASIVVAFKDNSEQGQAFKACMGSIWSKIMGIIVIQAVFALTNALLNLPTSIGAALASGSQSQSAMGTDLGKGMIMFINALIFGASYLVADQLAGFFFGGLGGLKSMSQELQQMNGMGKQNMGAGMARGAQNTIGTGNQQIGKGAKGIQGINENRMHTWGKENVGKNWSGMSHRQQKSAFKSRKK